MRRVAAAAVVMACGAKPPEPLPPVHVATPPVEPAKARPAPPIHVPRPALTIQEPRPDLTEEPRWPLSTSQHPTLEPQFDVAAALADPGITWVELCERGVQYRRDPAHRDELAYLGAWCDAEKHDATAAVTALVPMLDAPAPRIANGIPFDIVNILVSSLDADHAIQLLTDLKVRDAHLYDVLAAAYFEVGKNDDAVRATSTAMQVDGHPMVATTCHRLAREILLGSDGWRPHLLDQLDNLSTPVINDRVCEDLDMRMHCALRQPPDCDGYYVSQNVPMDQRALINQYDRWDSRKRDWLEWLTYAQTMRMALSIPDGRTLMLAAIDAAVVTSDCDHKALEDAWRVTDAMVNTHLPELAAKASQLHDFIDQRADCEHFRAQWLLEHPQ